LETRPLSRPAGLCHCHHRAWHSNCARGRTLPWRRAGGDDVTVHVCVCRSAASVATVLPGNALVIVGGRRRWWRSRDERL